MSVSARHRAGTAVSIEMNAGVRRSEPFPHFVTLAVETGMRRSEVLGLLWANVDLESRAVPQAPYTHLSAGDLA
jgi:integrase